MKKIAGIITVIIIMFAGGISALALTEGDYEYTVKDNAATITMASQTLSGGGCCF